MNKADILLNGERVAFVSFHRMEVKDNSVLLYNEIGDVIHAIPSGGEYMVLSIPDESDDKKRNAVREVSIDLMKKRLDAQAKAGVECMEELSRFLLNQP